MNLRPFPQPFGERLTGLFRAAADPGIRSNLSRERSGKTAVFPNYSRRSGGHFRMPGDAYQHGLWRELRPTRGSRARDWPTRVVASESVGEGKRPIRDCRNMLKGPEIQRGSFASRTAGICERVWMCPIQSQSLAYPRVSCRPPPPSLPRPIGVS